MEAISIQRYIHTTPRKLRLVADMVRTLEPNLAVETLRFTNKAAAVDLGKAIKTALANAKGKGMEEYIFKSLEINEGSKMKRFRAGTRGRAKPFARRMAHIKVVLTDEVRVQNAELRVESKNKKEIVPVIASEVVDERGNLPSQEDPHVADAPQDDNTKKAKPAKKEKK